MLVFTRVHFSRFLALLLVVHGLTQCAVMTRFQSPSGSGGDDPEETQVSKEDGEEENGKEESAGAEGEEEENENVRLIAVDQTPFFRWLRSGLKDGAKPTRFLDGGTEVELLKEKEEEKFSRIRLPDGKKGWVPSRLLKEKAPEETSTGDDPGLLGDSGGDEPGVEDTWPELEPSRLPDDTSDLPPLSEDIGQPIIPGFGIIEPSNRAPNPDSSSDVDGAGEVEKGDEPSDAAALPAEKLPD